MIPHMIATGMIFAILAALLHCYIFYMESIAWTSIRVRKTFGLTKAEADATKEMAFNQGFYNLFLAILAAIGALFFFAFSESTGITLALAGVTPMLAAALVLFLTSPSKRRAAVSQGALPLLSVISIAMGIAWGGV